MSKHWWYVCFIILIAGCQKEIELQKPEWNCELVCTNTLERKFTVAWYDHEWNVGSFDLDTVRVYFTYHLNDVAIFTSDGKGTMTLYMDGYEHFSVSHCGKHTEYLKIH